MRPAGWLEQLVASGEYERLARECKSDAEIAARLGTTKNALQKARKRLNRRGIETPTAQAARLPEAWTALSERFQSVAAAPMQSVGERLECGCRAGRRHSKSNCKMGLPSDPADIGKADKPTPGAVGGDFLDEITEERGLEFEDEEPTQPGAPPLPTIPSGHRVHKVSTLIDATTGEQRLQWIKTTAQNDERRAWLDAIRDMGGELPRIEPTAAPEHSDDDLLAVYPVGDPHVGLLGWREDAGEDFDMTIAERNLVGAFRHLIDLAPAAAQALLIFIGDNTHVDGQHNTTTFGTRQDADSRTVKMARTIIRICRQSIALALAKHERVRMIVERGNHDELISAMVALALSLAYENEPRVEIDVSPEMYHWFRFDRVLIGTHHGDKAKPMDLLGVMAVDRADDWSETKHRRFYLGHYHHQIVKEVPGLIVEYLPTLAGSDAWHRSMGYRSQRAMYMDVFHREHGHINRHIVGIGQLRGAA